MSAFTKANKAVARPFQWVLGITATLAPWIKWVVVIAAVLAFVLAWLVFMAGWFLIQFWFWVGALVFASFGGKGY